MWAEALLVNCSGAGIEHEPGVGEGENLAKNTGSVNSEGGGWGQVSVVCGDVDGLFVYLPRTAFCAHMF